MSREYNFKFPVVLSGFIVSFIPGQLVEKGLWDRLPHNLLHKINDAAESWNNLVLTKEDLDEIDDATWLQIAELIAPYI